MTRNEALAGYPVVISAPVWWGDQDAFGHVNNTVYFRWYESARIAYFDRLGLQGPSPHDPLGPILAAISGNYKRQLKYPDTVDVGARITRMGRTSLTMEHLVFSHQLGDIAANGNSTVVVFHYTENRPHPVPTAIRQRIEQIEQRSFDAPASEPE
jgi:acyl-CoA thioester hydrolase